MRLVELRGVAAGFPFYGTIELEQGGRVRARAASPDHGAVVQPEFLIALGLEVGDTLRLAGQPFDVRGAIAKDRVQRGGIAFGPRVYVDLADLKATSLLGFGSRASYQLLARYPTTRAD